MASKSREMPTVQETIVALGIPPEVAAEFQRADFPGLIEHAADVAVEDVDEELEGAGTHRIATVVLREILGGKDMDPVDQGVIATLATMVLTSWGYEVRPKEGA